MAQGLLIVVSGPSGAGKGTICKQLIQKEPTLKLSISATTRKPRLGEIDKQNYYFMTVSEFEEMIQKDEFLEYANVYGNYYGTPKKYVIDEIQKGNHVLLEIDTQGAFQIKKKYPEGVFIFILPPSMKELKHRIVGRGTETQEAIERRYQSAFDEISSLKEYDYYVINDEVDKAVEKIQAIIQAEMCKVSRNAKNIIQGFKEELSC